MKMYVQLFVGKLLLYLCLLFICITSNAQDKHETKWMYTYGGSKTDEVRAVIPTSDGKYALIGFSQSDGGKDQEGGDDDVLFMILDKNGKADVMKNLGTKYKESAFDLIQTFDGGFAVVGFTDSKTENSLGGKDGWLLKINNEGYLLWEKRFGGGSDDILNTIIQLDNGDLVAVGEQKGKLLFVKTDWKGETIINKTLPIKGQQIAANAIEKTVYDNLIIVGHSDGKPLFVKTDLDGELKQEELLFKSKGTAVDITETQQNTFAILVRKNELSTGDDFGLILTNRKGELQQEFSYGSRGKDIPYALLESFDGSIFLAGGRTESNQQRFPRFFLSAINEEGEELWKDWYEGNTSSRKAKITRGNFATTVTQDYEGNLILAGFIEQGASFGGKSDVLVMKIAHSLPQISQSTNIVAESTASIIDENEDGILESGERAYLQFSLSNNGNFPAQNIVANITRTEGNDKINYLEKSYLSYLHSGQKKYFSIPLKGLSELDGGNNQFQIRFEEANGAKINDLEFEVLTKREPRTEIAISNYQFKVGNREAFERMAPITLTLNIENKGDLKTNNINGFFAVEKNISALSDKKIEIGTLEPGENKELKFVFKVDPIFDGDNTNIGFRFYADDDKYIGGVDTDFRLDIEGKAMSLPTIVLNDYIFEPSEGEEIQRGQAINLKAIIENHGDLDATNIDVKFDHLVEVISLDEKAANLTILKGKEEKAFNYQFKVPADFKGNSIEISCRISADELPTREEVLTLRLPAVIPPQLAVVQGQFQKEPAIRNTQNQLNFILENKGGIQAKDIVITFTTDEGIVPLAEKLIKIDEIEKGEQIELSIPFEVNSAYPPSFSIINMEIEADNPISQEPLKIDRTFHLDIEPYRPPYLAIESFFETKSDKAERGEEVVWIIKIKNDGGNPITDLRAKFDKTPYLKLLDDKIRELGILEEGEQKAFSFTLKIDEKVQENQLYPQVIFSSPSLENGSKTTFQNLRIQPLQPPLIMVEDYAWKSSSEISKRKEPISLKISLINEGQKAAEKIRLEFKHDANAIATSNQDLIIDEIQAGKKEDIVYTFEIDENYEKASYAIEVVAFLDEEQIFAKSYECPLQALSDPLLVIKEKKFLFEGEEPKRGEVVKLLVTIQNKGEKTAPQIKSEFSTRYEGLILLSEPSLEISSLKANEEKQLELSFKIEETYNPDYDEIGIDFEATAKNEQYDLEIYPRLFKQNIKAIPLASLIVQKEDFSTENRSAKRGEEIELDINIKNTGGRTATNVTVSISSEFLEIQKEAQQISSINAESQSNATFKFKLKESFLDERLPILLSYQAEHQEQAKTKTIYLIVEPFEEAKAPTIALDMENPFFKSSQGREPFTEKVNMTLTLNNIGEEMASDLKIELLSADGIAIEGEKEIQQASLAPQSSTDFDISLTVNKEKINESPLIGIKVTANQDPFKEGKVYEFPLDILPLKPARLYVDDESGFDEKVLDSKGYASRSVPVILTCIVKNTGEKTAYNLTGSFEAEAGSKPVSVHSQTIKELQGGKEYRFKYEFEVDENYDKAQHKIVFNVNDDKGNLSTHESYSLIMRPRPESKLHMSGFYLVGNEAEFNKEETINLKLTNAGGKSTGKLDVIFKTEKGVIPLNGLEAQIISSIDAGLDDIRPFVFKVIEDFEGTETTIEFIVKEKKNNGKILLEGSQTFAIKRTPPFITIKHDFNELEKIQRGVSNKFQITVRNERGSTAKNLTIEIIPTDNLTTKNTLYKLDELLVGEERQFTFEFEANEKAAGSQEEIIIQVKSLIEASATIAIDERKQIKVEIQELLFPNLIVEKHEFEPAIAKEGDIVTLTIVLANRGNGKAIKVVSSFFWNGTRLDDISDKNQPTVDEILPNEFQTFSYKFRVGKTFENSKTTEVGFKYATAEEKYKQPIKERYYLPLESTKMPPKLEVIEEVAWHEPLDNNIETYKAFYPVKFRIIVHKEIDQYKHFTLKVNDKVYKLDSIRAKGGEKKLGKPYLINVNIPLTLGENRVKLIGEYEGEIKESEEKIFTYELSPINIHVLSIGINNYRTSSLRPLKYAKKDAEDIVNYFASLENRDYINRVYKKLVVEDESNKYFNTSKSNIKTAINDFRLKSKTHHEEYIEENDIVIIFLSGHGKTDRTGENSYLLPSDYEKRIEGDTKSEMNDDALNIQEQIIQKLDEAFYDRHVFVFIDACHSGAIPDLKTSSKGVDPSIEFPKILDDLINKEHDIRIISSSGSEQSYEGEDEENGLFTKALLEAFKNQEVPVGDEKLKADHLEIDNILSFIELFRFSHKRVKYLAEKYQHIQLPSTNKEHLNPENDIKFLILENK